MKNPLAKFPEWRILAVLGIITLSWHILTIASAILGSVADIFFLIILSWILAFILEPLVDLLQQKQIGRTFAAIIIYLGIATFAVLLFWSILPTTISQLTQFGNILPNLIPQNSPWSARIEGFANNTFSNSINIASQFASALTSSVLIFILSFYIMLSKKEISAFILNLIPHDYADDYLFLEKTINTTFAKFLRSQVVMGLTTGAVVLITLLVLRVDFALSTALLSAILGAIPVVGPVLFLIPPALASALISSQKFIITEAILLLSSQLIYNVWGPRLMGDALQIHPIVVLISFVTGYKIAGIWGAIFAVPVASVITIIGKELIKYWQEEADK